MSRDSMIRRIVKKTAGSMAFQEKEWLGFKARCRAGSDNLVVSSSSNAFLEIS